jgi:hypothetical protein
MKLPWGIVPGAGIGEDGRRLAVTFLHWALGEDGDGDGADAWVSSAASVVRAARSEVPAQPPTAATISASARRREAVRVIGSR